MSVSGTGRPAGGENPTSFCADFGGSCIDKFAHPADGSLRDAEFVIGPQTYTVHSLNHGAGSRVDSELNLTLDKLIPAAISVKGHPRQGTSAKVRRLPCPV